MTQFYSDAANGSLPELSYLNPSWCGVGTTMHDSGLISDSEAFIKKEFDSLGGYIPTLLISPGVSQGLIEQKGANHQGKTVSYLASSLLRTLGCLRDFEPSTPRINDTASFEHLIQSTPHKDTPSTLLSPVAFSD
ncbi:hypothetical protein N7532_000548 [Penicillium argentinense]|uniref:Uncharacterized protein n=1 Tax=Penicillium argentinense TaxID=1131581 RepID=A0A9W9G5Y2_9EURO|nr:uncharacterized protein N7532_000548 [Penicillium argentinense]KAJ5112503.1 hypothetical protein N7532_000548 [Penicillium argentinense]